MLTWPSKSAYFPSLQIIRCSVICIEDHDEYKKCGSSRIVVELGEADQDSLFKVDKIPKSVTHTFHCLDRIVNALNDTCGHPIYKVV